LEQLRIEGVNLSDREQAYKLIAEKCVILRQLFDECVKIADEAQVEFELPFGGEGCSAQDGYGAGATYYPDGVDNWCKNYIDIAEWVSSSRTC
jgi:hypothetical protein